MKYSAYTHDIYNTFDKVVSAFSYKFFNSDDEETGLNFLYSFGDYLDDTKFPCDKMILCAFAGYCNCFDLTLQYNGKRVAWLEIEGKKHGIMCILNSSYESKEIKDMFHKIIEEYFDKLNSKIFQKYIELCGIVVDSEENEVKVDEYVDYKANGKSVVLTGSLAKIFDDYTTHNDRLRYCNGDYWRFNNSDVADLYHIFIETYKRNYFLDNAVKRGCIID